MSEIEECDSDLTVQWQCPNVQYCMYVELLYVFKLMGC